MIRILLADADVLCRAGLHAILDEMPDVEVVAEVSEGHEALRAIDKLKPDVALLDASLPGLNGLEVATRVGRHPRRTRIVVLFARAGDQDIRRALAAGVDGYLLRSSGRGEFEQALRVVAGGNRWVAPELTGRIAAAFWRNGTEAHDAVEALTLRQREVLQLVAEGLSTKEIAWRLHLSTKTVETHRTQIMRRLDIHGIAGLVRYAVRAGIVAAGA
jgi:DNA-binding NarL/FixJ family response regulator